MKTYSERQQKLVTKQEKKQDTLTAQEQDVQNIQKQQEESEKRVIALEQELEKVRCERDEAVSRISRTNTIGINVNSIRQQYESTINALEKKLLQSRGDNDITTRQRTVLLQQKQKIITSLQQEIQNINQQKVELLRKIQNNSRNFDKIRREQQRQLVQQSKEIQRKEYMYRSTLAKQEGERRVSKQHTIENHSLRTMIRTLRGSSRRRVLQPMLQNYRTAVQNVMTPTTTNITTTNNNNTTRNILRLSDNAVLPTRLRFVFSIYQNQIKYIKYNIQLETEEAAYLESEPSHDSIKILENSIESLRTLCDNQHIYIQVQLQQYIQKYLSSVSHYLTITFTTIPDMVNFLLQQIKTVNEESSSYNQIQGFFNLAYVQQPSTIENNNDTTSNNNVRMTYCLLDIEEIISLYKSANIPQKRSVIYYQQQYDSIHKLICSIVVQMQQAFLSIYINENDIYDKNIYTHKEANDDNRCDKRRKLILKLQDTSNTTTNISINKFYQNILDIQNKYRNLQCNLFSEDIYQQQHQIQQQIPIDINISNDIINNIQTISQTIFSYEILFQDTKISDINHQLQLCILQYILPNTQLAAFLHHLQQVVSQLVISNTVPNTINPVHHRLNYNEKQLQTLEMRKQLYLQQMGKSPSYAIPTLSSLAALSVMRAFRTKAAEASKVRQLKACVRIYICVINVYVKIYYIYIYITGQNNIYTKHQRTRY